MRRLCSVSMVLALVLVAACSGSKGGSSTSTTSQADTGSSTGPSADITLPPPGDATVLATAEAELAMTWGMQEDLGLAEAFGEDGPALVDGRHAAETEFGETTVLAFAEELGVDLTAGSGLSVSLGDALPTADWSGSSVGDATFTASMMMGMMSSFVERADVEQPLSRTERTETYNPAQQGDLRESVRITTRLGLRTGEGQMHGEVSILSTTTVSSADGATVGTMVGAAEGSFDVLACPEPDGSAEGHYVLDVAQGYTQVGAPSVTSTRRIDAPFTLTADDNAVLVGARFTANVDAQGRTGGGDPWNVSAVVPVAILGPPSGTASETSDNATPAQVNSVRGSTLMPYMAISLASQAAEKFWRSGKCVDLVTSEESREVDPSEEVEFDVSAKQRFDGGEIERPIIATFTGKESITPESGTPVDPPASYTFTAGSEDGDKGTIKLEQKSKRGIGRKTLEFEVKPQDLLFDLDGTYVLDLGDGEINVHFVVSDLPLTRGDDGVYRGSGTGTVVGGSVLTGECTATADSPVSLSVEGRLNETDSEMIRVVIPVESLSGTVTETCPGMDPIPVPVGAAVGNIVASAGRSEIRIGEPTTQTISAPGGGVQAVVTVTPKE